MRVSCLASGSSGNSILVEANGRALLVDAGLSGRKLLAMLGERGTGRGALDGVLLTHEHTDHTSGAQVVAGRLDAPLLANAATLAALPRRARESGSRALPTGLTASVGAFEVTSFPVSHDAEEPVGYVVEAGGVLIAVMTDLGCTTPELLDPVRRSDLVIVESNHDTQLLVDGPYPEHLKRRIMSDRGHLSNAQTSELIATAAGSRRQTYWLAHLSKTNNRPTKARRRVLDQLAALGVSADVLVTARDKPSLVWEPSGEAFQPPLFKGESPSP